MWIFTYRIDTLVCVTLVISIITDFINVRNRIFPNYSLILEYSIYILEKEDKYLKNTGYGYGKYYHTNIDNCYIVGLFL